MLETLTRGRLRPANRLAARRRSGRWPAALAALALGGCAAGADPVWTVSQWGCAVGSCLPEPDGQYQCLANDVGAHIWLDRAPTREPAAATAEEECTAESESPGTCVVVLDDCARQLPYCTGPEDRSMHCRLFGPPGAGAG